ncbi:MarR family transcriptional regulator [Kribbella sp. NPDC056861]|uniref:MarR family winged helix-turn-helix transcriptional regulator n=1 Tax=Kribbella sp. NPDC056861 TaxID=3154857 RepID=UPI0034280729
MEGAIGTRLRHVLELLDGDVAKVYLDLGLPEYRPRFSPIVRTLVAEGPLSIRALATAVGVTHSAASQTVAQLNRAGFVTLEPGADARQRIVHLTPKTRDLLPTIEAEWQATTAALAGLDEELSVPLAQLLDELVAAVERRSFHERIRSQSTPV